ncbi:protein TASOR 2 isoform X2 [Tiliqua scincoides]
MNFLIGELSILGRCAPCVTKILQHCEPKRMSPLNHKSLAECKTKVLYCVWKGQLFIQGQQVCDIALWSPSSGSIPAQLPAKLEIRYVVDVSELRKKLPEAAFGKNTCANDKACNRGILFSLYEVELFSQEEVKVDQLIESLKEKDLALVKYLNDQGILLLLASSTLLKGEDSGRDESSSCLQALFLISSQNTIGLIAKDLNCKPEQHERASEVTLVLPGLHYALGEAAKHPDKEGNPPGSLVEQHIQNFAKFDRDSLPPFDKLDSLPSSFDLFLKRSDLDVVSEKCSPNSLSCLQFYLSDPSNYTLELAAAVAYFEDHSRSPSRGKVCEAERSVGLHSDALPPGVVELVRPQHAAQSNPCSKNCSLKTGQTKVWPLLGNKRKSSRLRANSRKKWPPLKALCNLESCKKRTKIRKKKTSLFISSSKSTRPQTDSDGPTVKLKNLQCPFQGKRGAEVLSAEFVQRPRCELAASEGIEQKKPRLLKHIKDLDADKVTSEDKTNKRRPIKKKSVICSMGVISLESPREADNENNPSDERTVTQDVSQSLRKDEYDSHALNMLADLALSSCNSVLINNGNTPVLPCSPSQERHRLQKGKILHRSSDHEYHRVTKKRKGAPISVQTRPPFLLSSGQPDLSAESLSSSQEKGRLNHSKKRCVRSSLTKSHAVLARQAGDISDSSTPSLISSEHSYASTVLELSKKQLLLKGVHSSLNSKNGVKNTKSVSSLGKVLPFRHQQNICQLHKQFKSYVPLRRSAIMAARPKEDFSKFRKVTCCDETVQVTCQWEAEYLFSLDSKYTNNSLEKTVIRAVHGPWDISTTDDVEEMKLILYMWVALFYSRQVNSPTIRKVVEHSNPAKYVSLNSVVDPLEPLDDYGGSYSLEKCPADSLSEVDQVFSRVEERACPPSEKPLSCNELSSTNCIESEPPLCVEKLSDLSLKDDQVDTTTSNSEATVHFFDKVAGEDSEDIVLDPVISDNHLNESSSNKLIDRCLRSQAHRSQAHRHIDGEIKANQAVNFAEVSQSDTASVPPASPADLADRQAVASSKAAASVENQEIDSRSPYVEERCCCQTSSVGSPNASEEPWLETSAECRDGSCREVGNLTRLSINEEKDIDGENVELESIDLVLSESNDADSEPRDMDLDEENEVLEKSFMTEETEAAAVYDAASPDDSPFTLITSSATVSVHRESPKEGTELHGNQDDSVVSASSSPAPNQRGLVEGFCPLQEDQGENGVDLVSQQVHAVHQTALEEVTEPLRIEDSVVSAKHPIFPNQLDVVEGSYICQEDEGIKLDDSPSWQVSPVHQTTCDEEAELSGNRENVVVSTKPLELPNQITLIEDISQEDMADSAQLQTCELHPVQKSMSTQEESKGNVSIVFAQHVTPSEQLDLVEDVSISKEEEGLHLTETAPLQASESDEVQSIAITGEEQQARQSPELQSGSPDAKEKRSLGLNSLVPEAKPEDDNTGDLSVTQEVGCGGDKLNQITVTLSEDIRSLLSELIDTVSALTVVSEETCSKVNSDLNWRGFVTLECVSPPESDEESCSTDPKLIVNEHLKQNCIFVDQMTDLHATLQGHSTLHESVSSDQANMIERELVQENENVSSISGCMEWTRIGTRSLECSASIAEAPLSKGKNSSVSVMCELGPASYEASTSERDRVREAYAEILPYAPGEHHIVYLSEESDLPRHGDAGESLTLGDSENPFSEWLTKERVQLPVRAMDANMNLEYKFPTAEDDQEPFGNPSHGSPPGSSSYMSLTDSPGAAGANHVCGLNPEEEISKSGNWMYLENKKRVSGAESKQYDWPSTARKGDKSISPAFGIDSDLGQLKYINFSVTKKHKDKTRTFHSSKRCDTFVGESGLINSLSRTWRFWDDPIQSTLDMECLRFHYKLKETLARNNSQLSTSSNICAKYFSPRVRAETLSLKDAAAAAPAPSLPARSRSPLLITIRNPGPRQRISSWYPRSSTDFLEPPPVLAVAQDSVGKAAKCQSQGQEPFSPFCLNKPTHNNKLKDSWGDISVIMDEFVELSKVIKLGDRQTSNKERDLSSTSEGAPAPEKRSSSLPQRMASYESLFTELCHTLHFRLKNVVKEASKTPYMFYLMETDDNPFFGRLKNLLKKEGHTEAEPLHFLKASNPETDSLKVIIRNEDIFPHIHKIPSLLRLKHLPNVTFVGVDSPEDVLDNTCQELFHSGGFVVSDDSVLQAMTVEELKDTVKTLEKLNGRGRWRWLLHYKETKKLREDTRVDSAAHAKDMILRSCQGANIMEVLHYHQCDSKSTQRSEYLKCLLNLQVQHIWRRFAVFLTEKPRANREFLESKGILALDVSTFIVTAQDMAAPFRSGC